MDTKPVNRPGYFTLSPCKIVCSHNMMMKAWIERIEYCPNSLVEVDVILLSFKDSEADTTNMQCAQMCS